MKQRTALSFLLWVLATSVVVAQDSGQDPNLMRGVSAAGRLYSVHDLDAISQFNGI